MWGWRGRWRWRWCWCWCWEPSENWLGGAFILEQAYLLLMLIAKAATDAFCRERDFHTRRSIAFDDEHGARPLEGALFRETLGGSKRHVVLRM
jgi:hypothetical protein